MNIHKKITVGLITVLLVFAGRCEQLWDRFWSLPIWAMVFLAMGSLGAITLIVLRAFGVIDIFTILGI